MGGGDLILVLDLPDVFTIGYDSVSFTAKQFRGLREVPPGVHFLWVSHPNGFSTRCGTWVIGSSEGIRVHVLQWDKYNEILGEAAHAEERIQAAGVDETTFHRLAPYRDPAAVNQEAMAQPSAAVSERRLELWNQLTDSVSPSVLDRITAQQGHGHWFVHTADRVKGSVLMAAEMELDRRVSQNPYLQVRELNFALSQLSRTYSTDNTGADRTSDATDATVYLESLLKDHSGGLTQADIIGEFQLAYILGTHLGNDSCMQQWWHMLLKIVLRAYVLPERHPELASALLRTLAAQLSHSTEILDTSVLEYSDTQSRDLRLALTVYKRRLDELCANGGTGQLATATALSQVEAVVAAPPLDWDLDSENYLRRGKATLEDGEEVELEMDELEAEDERGEWAPEIVELDEQGRPRDLVSWTD
jgi:A1 cistron-splicing factor AAR2